MKNLLLSKDVEKYVAQLFSDGKILVQARDEETNKPMFLASKHIIKVKTSPNFGKTLYGLFRYENGKWILFCTATTKKTIMSNFYNYVPSGLKI